MPLGKTKPRGGFGKELHNNPELVEMAFIVSKEIMDSSTFFKPRHDHVMGCEDCQRILRERVKFY